MKAATFVLLTLMSASALAVTIHVPTEQPTIQAGIDAASAGDTVLVADGTYTGEGNRDISFDGKPVTVRSENGPTATIIDCEGSVDNYYRGFYFGLGEGPTFEIDGFTITNGYGYGIGGAILCQDASPMIRNCIFANNKSLGSGGAIALYSSFPQIRYCLFVDNEAPDRGGAMYLDHSRPMIFNCTFYRNGAEGGGGAYYSYYSDAVLYNTLITASTYNNLAYEDEGRNHGSQFSCCNIWGNDGGNWTGYPSPLGQNGNIMEPPEFCSPDPTVFPDDLYISSTSPCAPANNECEELIGAYGVACGATDVEDDFLGEMLPNDFVLAQNYPNPFNPATMISFDLPRAARVRLTVYNVLGQEVATLLDERLSAGRHTEVWDGSASPSGIYFYRLKTGAFKATRKMVLVK